MDIRERERKNIRRLYHIYQLSEMMRKDVSLEEVLEDAFSMKATHEKVRKLTDNATPQYLIEHLGSGHGDDGAQIWWVSFRAFCDNITAFFDELCPLIRCCLPEEEAKELIRWYDSYCDMLVGDGDDYCRRYYDSSEEDDADDDWLGPHPEETWDNIYSKD